MRAALALASLALAAAACAKPPRAATPAEAPPGGFDPARLSRLDGAVAEAVAAGEVPGAVVAVGRHGKLVFERAHGLRAVEPTREAMTVDTIFDLASLTKVMATAPAVMLLVEEGKVRLSDPVGRHLPEFAAAGGGREAVTIEQLLVHRGGLAADDPLSLYAGSPAEIFARKDQQKLAARPGERFLYSDVGFETLGRLVERVSGDPLDRFARDRIFAPLGMADTHYRRVAEPAPFPLARVAPTERVGGAALRGVVHDPRARALGGVAGHAGVFGTARDLAAFCAEILGPRGRVLARDTVAAMTRPRFCGDPNLRGLGWDIATAYSGPRGDLFPRGSFGHTGFTGTSIWLDPSSESFVILLTSALHPDGKGSVLALRRRVGTLAAAALDPVDRDEWERLDHATGALLALGAAASRPAPATDEGPRPASRGAVRPGVEVLEARGFAPLSHKKIALLTNPTGRTRDGRSTIDVLRSEAARAAGVELAALFSPEHGIRGDHDEDVADSADAKSGLPIRSLYGERRRPRAEQLRGLDALVVDLQDAGCRFYTYLATVGYCLEECAKLGIEVVVLDRPDPIGADRFEGPLLDAERSSFIGYHRLPIRTGLTIGECAKLFDAERGIGARLAVVPMEGYSRGLWYDETGLPWVNPSPNLRSVTQAALYPGIGLLEFTNVSVGRGTDAPFEWFGAPWMDAPRVAAALSARGIAGVRFAPQRLVPASSLFKGQECSGVRVTIVDRAALRAVALGLAVAAALRDLHSQEWDSKRFPELLGNAALAARFAAGAPVEELLRLAEADAADFARRREPFLLYPNER